MPLTPNIAYNSEPAVEGDVYNHSVITPPALLQEGSSGYINTGNSSDLLKAYISHNHDDKIYECKWYIQSYDKANLNALWGTGQNINLLNQLPTTKALGFLVGEEVDNLTWPKTFAITDDIKISLDGGVAVNVPLINTGSYVGAGTAGQHFSWATIITNINLDLIAAGFTNTPGSNDGVVASIYYTGGNPGAATARMIITSQQYLDTSEVQISAGTVSDARAKIGMVNPYKNYKSAYANVTGGNGATAQRLSAEADITELLYWADNNLSDNPAVGKGIFITEDDGVTYRQVKTGFADTYGNRTAYLGGDAESIGGSGIWDAILEFDFSGGEEEGQGLLGFVVSVPSDEPETGLRELEYVLEFTYN